MYDFNIRPNVYVTNLEWNNINKCKKYVFSTVYKLFIKIWQSDVFLLL